MIFWLNIKSKSAISSIVCFSILLSFIANGYAFQQAQLGYSIGLKLSSHIIVPGFSINNKKYRVLTLHGYIPDPTSRVINSISEEVEIESLDSFVIIRQTVLEEDIQPAIVLSFEQFREIVQEGRMKSFWQEHVINQLSVKGEGERGAGGINLEIPVKIKSRAFQKIFGSGSVGLTVSGNITMKAKLRREDRSEVRSLLNQGSNTNFNMQQTQRFSVAGKIGDKVTVNVDQDSERAFDFENNIRLRYQGYDDEILQSLEAGNISLSLPGTRYVTFSGKNSGLFGIKSQMVLGNLHVTAIASQEKGESQRISLSGGAETAPRRIKDYQYLRNTYFYLDTLYRSNKKNITTDGVPIAVDTDKEIKTIEVYKAAAGYETQYPDKNIRAWATYDATTDTTTKQGVADIGHFIRLETDEYHLEPELGYIRLYNRMAKDEILAVTYTTMDDSSFGETVNNTTIFKLIKPKNPQPKDLTWGLVWKNVYSLGGRNIPEEGFDLKIYYEPSSGVAQETDESGKKWISIFGLDTRDQDGDPDNVDGKIDFDPYIVDLFNGELHFPDLRPFDPEPDDYVGNSQIPFPQDKRTSAIYDTTVQSVISQQSKFYIEVTTQNKSSEFNLGFNVIEGSEKVVLDGTELVNGQDYKIDYFTGSLTLLNERATAASAQLDISYERNQLFQLEKKTILGVRAEYDLGRNSFLGGTFLYLNESTLDRKVRVGRGPIKNLVWDLNTRLNFKPNFVGKVFDFMPFIRAKGESSLDFEGEIAQVLPTPNTLNSPNTGDKHGVAYIDDFEGAKKTVNLGVLRKNWTRASQPDTSEHSYRNMVNYIWYNPFQQVAIKEIYPNREVNPNVPNRMNVLTLQITPDPNKPSPNSWGGMMRALSPGVFDQSQTKFIEVMVQGGAGRLHIDLGTISEDIIPNNRLDTEDKIIGGIRNGILDEDRNEDVGIDGVEKPDPPELNYPRDEPNFLGKHINEVDYDFWDIDKDSLKDADEPWSYDDWYYVEKSATYLDEKGSISGEENNANDQGGRRPDTEDINGNGILDQANAYYSYSFSLKKSHPDYSLVVGGNDTLGWKLYRIPFDTGNDSLQVGVPNPTQIEYVRIWMDEIEDYNNPIRINIADISLVGSDWKELGVTDDEFNLTSGLITKGDSTVAITQFNTHENPLYATTLSQIGVEGEEDKVTGVRAREQSMVLQATNLDAQNGRNVGVTQKSLFQGENYIHYERIKMYVYGEPEFFTDHDHIPTDTSGVSASHLEYFFRFGADKNNYYEYRSPIYQEWNLKNHMDVELYEFTKLDITATDTLGHPYKELDDGKSIRKVGNPSLTNIKTLILGIKNLHPDRAFTGRVWFNELRLSDIEREKGMAMRFRANMKIANFATVNAEVEKRDADFHNVAERFGTGNNSFNTSINGSINLENFFPQSWGLSMPLTLNYRSSKSTPKYIPGKDKIVTNDWSKEELEPVETVRSQNGFNVSFRRQQKSKNFFIKNTIDNFSFNIGRSQSKGRNPSRVNEETLAWKGNMDYKIDFARDNYFSPFGWLPGLPLIGKLKGTKFYYTPQNMSVRINGSKTGQESLNRVQDVSKQDSVDATKTETFLIDKSFRTNMKIFDNLVFDFSRAYKTDMRGFDFNDFIKGNAEDINIAQTFSARYTPKFFNWLNNTFNYSSNYTFNNNIQQRLTGRSVRVNVTRSADFTLRLKELAQSIFGSGKKTTSRPDRGRPGNRPEPGGEKKSNPPKNEFRLFQEEQKEGRSFNPLRLFTGLFSKFKDISFNYTERKNFAQMGLDSTGTPGLEFQFGLSEDTKISSVAELSTNPFTRGENKTISASSGITFGRAFDVGLKFQHSEQSNQTTTISGSKSDSWLKFNEFDLPFPEWTVRITGLEKIPLLNKIFKTVSFSHGFAGKRDITWNGPEKKSTQKNISTNFRPLGKLDLNFKNGFTGNIQMNHSVTISKSLASGVGASRSTKSDISVTANYQKRSGFRLPIWPFNKKELNNEINFTFTFTQSKSTTEQSRTQLETGENKYEEQDKLERWAFSPKLTYSFSTQVRGGAFVEIGTTNSKRNGKTTIQEFGIDISIAISGR